MKRLLISSLIWVALANSAPAHHLDNYDERIRAEANLPAAWFNCKKNDDCELVSVPCQSGLAVSASYKKEAQDVLNHTYFFCLGSSAEDTTATCKARRCVTEQKQK
ncbi:MAG: hypothetical protein ACR650_05550 [Methylocystis sp.]|jgi:hypothetical protein